MDTVNGHKDLLYSSYPGIRRTQPSPLLLRMPRDAQYFVLHCVWSVTSHSGLVRW